MAPFWLILLMGFLFIILFGGLTLIRREGLSTRFAIEALVLTLLFAALTAFTNQGIHPVFFLIILYLVTMRVRLLVDAGNLLARRRSFTRAATLYRLAGSLWPDLSGQQTVKINQATLLLQQGQLSQSVDLFKEILQQSGQNPLGAKYLAAAHYNLGVTYHKLENENLAAAEFRAAIDVLPLSEFARLAQIALDRVKKG